MSNFPATLDARIGQRKVAGRWERVAILNRDFHYDSDLIGKVTIPAGFVSDGASVPRVLWSIYPPFGDYLEAAIVHDWYCVNKTIDSVTAAKVFREAMEVCGVGAWRRKKMYWAVRLFGPKFKKS